MDTGSYDRRRERHAWDFLGIAAAHYEPVRSEQGNLLPNVRTFPQSNGPDMKQLANYQLKAKLRYHTDPMNGSALASHS